VTDKATPSQGIDWRTDPVAPLADRPTAVRSGRRPCWRPCCATRSLWTRVSSEPCDLAAVGIVNSGWRNSPVEDWHAGDGPLSDGDMLRVNAHTTWRVREIMRRWRTEVGLTARSPMAALDWLDTDDSDRLAVRIFRWLVNPTRRLPTGVTLAALAGNDLGSLNPKPPNGSSPPALGTSEGRCLRSPTTLSFRRRQTRGPRRGAASAGELHPRTAEVDTPGPPG
jgi:hypothetical protein